MMDIKNELTFRPTPLDRCLLGFGLPLEREVFLREMAIDENKDFAKSFFPSLNDEARWNEYERRIVRPTQEIMAYAEINGVCVISHFDLKDMDRASDFDSITIFGHWLNEKEKVELADGIHSVDEFVSAIPENVECMLDLTVCYSIALLNEIKKRFGGKIIVSANTGKVLLQLHLWLFKQTIRIMVENKQLNFLDAGTFVRKDLARNPKKYLL